MYDVIDGISERTNLFHMSSYKSLVIGAKTFKNIFISDYQAHELMLQMVLMHFFNTFLILCIKCKIYSHE